MDHESQSSSDPGQPTAVRVFLVDDHRIFRRALARLLGRETGMEVAAEAGSLAEAYELLDASGASTSRSWTSACPTGTGRTS